jgi:hypothetical protein
MCLYKITKTGLNRNGFGWKVLMSYDGYLYSELRRTETIRPRNRWLHARRTNLGDYLSGFHIFLKKKQAIMWKGYGIVLKVKYRKGHTIGSQSMWSWSGGPGDTFNIIVADEMLILPEKKGKEIK